MRFHITYSPLGTLLSYHLRQTLAINHSISLIYNTRAQAQKSIAAGNVIRMEHAGMIMSACNIRSEALELPTAQTGVTARRRARKDTKLVKEDEPTAIDSLIITTSPTKTFATLRHLIPRLSVSSTIVLMHDGLGVYENLISNLFPNPRARPHFILAYSRHHAWQRSDNHVVHTRVGSVGFSIIPDPKGRDFEASLQAHDVPRLRRSLILRDIANPPDDPHSSEYMSLYNTVAALNKLGPLHVSWLPMEEGEVALRRELVVRSVVGALAVWLNCRNGDVFSTIEARRLGYVICEEAATAFRAQWCSELNATKAFSPKCVLPSVPVGLRKKALFTACAQFASVTRGDVNPMLIAIQAGERTQVRYELGYLLDIGVAYSVPMPTIRTLYKMIKARESIVNPIQ